MPNSAPSLRADLLAELGLDSAEPLFGQIPIEHRFDGDLMQPPALAEEVVLARHLRTTLARNITDNLSFLGGGIWQHHVPAVVDEIVNRAEFLTPVWGTPSSDFGRNQAWFEFTSQLGALLDLELVGLPVYSWGCAAGHAFRMAARLTNRRHVLIPSRLCPERRAVITAYCASADPSAAITLIDIPCDQLGRLDLVALSGLLTADVAAVYYENPSYLGGLEAGAAEIALLARAAGAETIAGINPISLGVIAPPGALGVDIAVGTIQPLGVHMAAGGGLGGFIASRDDARYAAQYPTLFNSLATTIDGEMAFGMMLFHQSSYGSRDEGNDWTGNSTYLWAIAATTYMALLGPTGFREVGALLLARTRDAALALGGIPGVRVVGGEGRFVDFIVDFNATGRRVADINKALLAHGIFGGIDLSQSFPDLGQCALYAVTEVHDADDIARLAAALTEVIA